MTSKKPVAWETTVNGDAFSVALIFIEVLIFVHMICSLRHGVV